MSTIRHYTFDEWLAINPDVLEFVVADERDCPECEGAGEVDCECSDCGDEHMAECADCEGTGVVTKTNAREAARQLYDERLKKDKALVERWTTIRKE